MQRHNASGFDLGDFSPCSTLLALNFDKCTSCGKVVNLPRRECTYSLVTRVPDRAKHVKVCLNPEHLNTWIWSEFCKDSNGNQLGCMTGRSGYCATCGKYIRGCDHCIGDNYSIADARASYVSVGWDYGTYASHGGDIVCRMCGEPYGHVDYTVNYIDTFTRRVTCDYTSYDAGKILYNNILLTDVDSITCHGEPSDVLWMNIVSSSINGNNGCSIVADYHFTKALGSSKSHAMHLSLPVALNDYSNLTIFPWIHIPMGFNTDPIAPTNLSKSFEGSRIREGWYTIGKVNSSWKDEYTSLLSVRLLDENRNVVQGWSNYDTSDGIEKFMKNYQITAEVVGNKTYYIQAKDLNNNLSAEIPIVINNLDSRAPIVVSSANTSTAWTTSKTWSAKATDTASKGVEISWNSTSDYVSADIVDSSTFKRDFKFTGDVTGHTVAVLNYRDKCGNVNSQFLNIWNIDNTNPRILSVEQSINDVANTTLSVSADDYCATIRKQGSGVVSYGISRENNIDTAEWQDSSNFIVSEGGTYYIWVKDLVGHTSDSLAVNVKVKVVITCELGDATSWIDGSTSDKTYTVITGNSVNLPSAIKKGYRHLSYSKVSGDCTLVNLIATAGGKNSTVRVVLTPNEYDIQYSEGLTNN